MLRRVLRDRQRLALRRVRRAIHASVDARGSATLRGDEDLSVRRRDVERGLLIVFPDFRARWIARDVSWRLRQHLRREIGGDAFDRTRRLRNEDRPCDASVILVAVRAFAKSRARARLSDDPTVTRALWRRARVKLVRVAPGHLEDFAGARRGVLQVRAFDHRVRRAAVVVVGELTSCVVRDGTRRRGKERDDRNARSHDAMHERRATRRPCGAPSKPISQLPSACRTRRRPCARPLRTRVGPSGSRVGAALRAPRRSADRACCTA